MTVTSAILSFVDPYLLQLHPRSVSIVGAQLASVIDVNTW